MILLVNILVCASLEGRKKLVHIDMNITHVDTFFPHKLYQINNMPHKQYQFYPKNFDKTSL